VLSSFNNSNETISRFLLERFGITNFKDFQTTYSEKEIGEFLNRQREKEEML